MEHKLIVAEYYAEKDTGQKKHRRKMHFLVNCSSFELFRAAPSKVRI